ncbi:unnamed protein product [Prorocentrum cordatum]|uniref:Uncharacterized protein n=1 Tax=Prorocentrum cordatum TaxID=2364126 RepID=A0ABN9PHF8_9DINO|nr:unnamed protein product [Polarella glacialis]
MGCQAASLRLPGPGAAFPRCERQCVVVVGGESGEDSGELGGAAAEQRPGVRRQDGRVVAAGRLSADAHAEDGHGARRGAGQGRGLPVRDAPALDSGSAAPTDLIVR